MFYSIINKYSRIKNEISRRFFSNRLFKLKKIILKITLKCVADCAACSMRREKYRDILDSDDRQMTTQDYEKMIADACSIGLKKITISGGEPTVFGETVKVAGLIKKKGLYCAVNTNGFGLQNMASDLAGAGVDEIIVSLDSMRPEVHDRLRKCPGLWDKAVAGIEELAMLRDSGKSNIRISVRSIMSRSFLPDIKEMIAFIYEEAVDTLYLDYAEASFGDEDVLPAISDIDDYMKDKLPGIIEIIRKSKFSHKQKNRLVRGFENIFVFPGITREDISRGIYRTGILPCSWPEHFALVYPNGDVWPCVGLDYRKECLAGNLFENRISEIFYSDQYYQYRKKRTKWCSLCPSNTIEIDINERSICK